MKMKFIVCLALLFPFLFVKAQYQVGINQTTPVNTLDVNGNASIGSSYSGVQNAPPDGLIIEGNVGLGTPLPIAKLHIETPVNSLGWLHTNGVVSLGSKVDSSSGQIGTISNDHLFLFTNNGLPTLSILNSGNVGIGTDTMQSLIGKLVVKSGGDSSFIISNASNQAKVRMGYNGNNSGHLTLYGPNSLRTANLQNLAGYPDNGQMHLFANGAIKVRISANQQNAGLVELIGQNGAHNVYMGPAAASHPNNGLMWIYDQVGVNQAGMHVDITNGLGYVWGDVKTFVADNPDDPETEIWYASLEGPEAGAYVRGEAELIDGKAIVELPRHFQNIASDNGITVFLNPGDPDSQGLAVVEKSSKSIVVQELNNRTGNYAFDYEVIAKRKGAGLEDFQVIRPKMKDPSGM